MIRVSGLGQLRLQGHPQIWNIGEHPTDQSWQFRVGMAVGNVDARILVGGRLGVGQGPPWRQVLARSARYVWRRTPLRTGISAPLYVLVSCPEHISEAVLTCSTWFSFHCPDSYKFSRPRKSLWAGLVDACLCPRVDECLRTKKSTDFWWARDVTCF